MAEDNSNHKWENYEQEFIEWLDDTIRDYEQRIKDLKKIKETVKSECIKDDSEYIYKQNISWGK